MNSLQRLVNFHGWLPMLLIGQEVLTSQAIFREIDDWWFASDILGICGQVQDHISQQHCFSVSNCTTSSHCEESLKESLHRLSSKFLSNFSASPCKLLKWRKEKTYIQNFIHHYIRSNSIILNMYKMDEKDEKKILILLLPTTESLATLFFYFLTSLLFVFVEKLAIVK